MLRSAERASRTVLITMITPRRSAATLLLAISHDTSVTIAEVAFLLLLIAGIWIALAWGLADKWSGSG